MSDLDKELKSALSMVHIGYKSSDGECNTTLTPNEVSLYVMLAVRGLGYMTKEEWELQAVKDGWLTPKQKEKIQKLVNDMANTAVDMSKLPVAIREVNSMTGEEFYARFDKEMDNISAGATFDNHDDVDKAYECAKKAAGIE